MTKIALIIGSTAKQSINRTVANYIVVQAPTGVIVEEVQIHDLPLYTQDRDAENVPAYDRVRAQIKAADAVLIVTPEHNRAMPAALKNLIDVASRPWGKSLWTGKKVAIAAASVGSSGGVHAGLQVRQSLQLLGANILLSPEVFVDRAGKLLKDGQLSDESTAEFLNRFAEAFYNWAKA